MRALHTTYTLLCSFGLLIVSARLLAAYVYLYISSNTNAQSSYAKPARHIQLYRATRMPHRLMGTPRATVLSATESIRISIRARLANEHGLAVELYVALHLEKLKSATFIYK